MRPEIPRELAVHPGPIASVYLEVSRDRGGAPHQVRLRWEALAHELREQGLWDPARAQVSFVPARVFEDPVTAELLPAAVAGEPGVEVAAVRIVAE